MGKSVFGGLQLGRLKLAYSAKETSQSLNRLNMNIAPINIILSWQRITKTLIRLRTYAQVDATVSIGPSLWSVTDRMECERSGNEILV